jgi:uncharacterized protein (TIGR02145 family)
VDYNNKGVMERLPVTSATASAGTVTKIPNNDKGVWIASNARTQGSFSATVKLLTAVKNVGGACVYASNYPPLVKYISASEISFTGTPEYKVVLERSDKSTYTATVGKGESLSIPSGEVIQSFTDRTGAPGIILAYNQPQGSCTYTESAVVGTFANFHNTSEYNSSSTYVSLTDERDNKIYPVVKIGGHWIMARNLNYQKGLAWRNSSSSPSTGIGSNTLLIGGFWCPGGNSSPSSNSLRESCDVWGALYSWETAMMVDGKWSNDSRNSTTWGSDPSYSTNTSNANTNNGGRGANNHGICPPNWHVPTDGEWGDLFNVMETGSKVHNTSIGWIGTTAGSRAKSKCTVGDNGTTGATYVSDTQANWYYNSSTLGVDFYGFRVLPAGYRAYDGIAFYSRGVSAHFWSSSAYSDTYAWRRHSWAGDARVYRNGDSYRSEGFSVRCIRD